MFREVEGVIWQFVYILFAIIVLALFASILNLSSRAWETLEAQDTASQNIKDYAAYAAYDDNLIRGQEMVNLISSTHGDPFVIVMDSSNTVLVTSYTDVTKGMTSDVINCTQPSKYPELEAARTRLAMLLTPSSNVGGLSLTYWDHTNNTVTNTNLQDWFLHRGGDSYKAYQTCLIYDSPDSTTVVGILAVEV